MESVKEKIISAEWRMFDQVHNIGGRADCQDNHKTFYIMRNSQLSAWTGAMLESYYEDLKEAKREGRNLLAEKYGYMMEKTSPSEYQKIRAMLPERSFEKRQLIHKICQVHMGWIKELAQEYPAILKRGRSISSQDDAYGWASFETYLAGELSTYSLKTLELYDRYIDKLEEEGSNLNRIILENEMSQYGFHTLEEAEESIKDHN